MKIQCRDCGADILPMLAGQLDEQCLLCQLGILPPPKAWMTTVSPGERELALLHARAYWRELGQRVAKSPSGIDSLSALERQYWAVGCLSDEVDQGGFEQFFHQHAYATYVEALRGLDSMGASSGFALLSRASYISTAGADLPDDVNARRILLASNWNQPMQQRLNKLRQQFCSDRVELDALWFDFGVEHGLLSRLASLSN